MVGAVHFDDLVAAIAETLLESRILVGYSGGLDSTLLLYAIKMACPKAQIIAVHCNHGIHKNADQWQEACRQQADQWQLDFETESFHLGADASELTARTARYECFARHMQPGTALALAQHADDQVETSLFRLFRGTGLKGLAGMPATRVFEQGRLIRPLLSLRKQQLKNIAQQQQLTWLEDSSNQDDQYDRNYIRNRVLAVIRQRWPNVDKQIYQAITGFCDDHQLLGEYADLLIERLDRKQEAYGFSLCLSTIEQLSQRQTDLVLRRILYSVEYAQANAEQLKQIRAQMMYSSTDAEPCYQFKRTELRRFNNRLYLLQLPNIELPEQIQWDSSEPLEIAGLGCLTQIQGANEHFVIRFRRGGERAKPAGRQRSQTLKKLMQEHKIEPWLRPIIPLIYLHEQLISIADLVPCSEHRFELTTQI